MPAGAAMLGIDFRSNGALYGVGSDSRVYTIDTLSGAASPVGGAFSPAASGEHFGLAYNAADDRLRLVSVEANQNLGLDPSTGATASADPDLAYAAGDPNAGGNPAISGAAYDAAGTLYALDATANALVRVASATGELTTVGTFGFNVYLCSGFDIDADGTAYATLSTDAGSEVYTIDLANGATTYLGQLPGECTASLSGHDLAAAPDRLAGWYQLVGFNGSLLPVELEDDSEPDAWRFHASALDDESGEITLVSAKGAVYLRRRHPGQ
jgi:hypothetical protein